MLEIQQDFQDMLKSSAELTKQYESNKALIDNMLNALSIYKCEQVVKDIKIHFNRLKDGKNPDKVYIQARGAVTFKKGKRKFVGVYLGSKKNVIDSKDEIRMYWKVKGETMVRQKILNTLKTELKLY